MSGTRRPTPAGLGQAYLMNEIHDAHKASYGIYGHRRIHAELVLGKRLHVSCGRVQRLMKCTGLQGIHRRRLAGCTRRVEAAVPSQDLVNRRFTASAPDRLYVADITQHRTAQGWFYLAVVLDVFSRRVVGWAMADHLRAELVVDALQMAIWQRCPGPGAIHHSDHGAQGGLNRSSQHLGNGGVRWVFVSGRERSSCIGVKSRLRVGRRSRGGRTGFASGRRSRSASRPRMRVSRRACRGRSGSAGFVTLAA